MGRTIPSFRLATDIEWKQWKIYQKYLDKKKNNDNNEQKLFKEMFFISRLYNSACSYATIPIRIYPILISITFHQYKYFFFKKGVKMIKKKMNGSNNNSITGISPYVEILQKRISAFKPRFEKGLAASKVADMVLEAVTADNPKVRYLVGEDALKMMEKRKNSTDEEITRLVMNSVLGGESS